MRKLPNKTRSGKEIKYNAKSELRNRKRASVKVQSRAARGNAKARRWQIIRHRCPGSRNCIPWATGAGIVVVDKRATFLDKPPENIACTELSLAEVYGTLCAHLLLRFSSLPLTNERRVQPSAFTADRIRILFYPDEGRKKLETEGLRGHRRKMSFQQSGGRFLRDGRNRTCQVYISEAHGSESERSGEAENKCGGTERRQEKRTKNNNNKETAPAERSKEIPLLPFDR